MSQCVCVKPANIASDAHNTLFVPNALHISHSLLHVDVRTFSFGTSAIVRSRKIAAAALELSEEEAGKGEGAVRGKAAGKKAYKRLQSNRISVALILNVLCAAAAQESNEDEAADDEGVVQGEAAGKEAYKRVQASSAAAIQRQKAARLQVQSILLQLALRQQVLMHFAIVAFASESALLCCTVALLQHDHSSCINIHVG